MIPSPDIPPDLSIQKTFIAIGLPRSEIGAGVAAALELMTASVGCD
jgi:hypothetical protein